MPTWREIMGAYHRRRRALRRAMLEPILVGWPTLRNVVMNALSARGHLIMCELGDVRFFADPGDRVVGSWLIWHGGWQRREIVRAVELLSAAGRLPADAVFVDVGAHIGTQTVYALRTGRFIRAVAFEPAPRNARLLEMNLDINRLADVTTVVPKAAGAFTGTAVLHLHPRNSGAHSVEAPPAVDGCEQVVVPMVRVEDELHALGLAAERIGLIWLDVEGYEPYALDGLAQLIACSVPIAFEFTPHRYSREARERLITMLDRRYTIVHSLARGDPAAGIRTLATRAATDDLLVF